MKSRIQLAFDFVNGTGDQETASRLDELAVQAGANLEIPFQGTFFPDTFIQDAFAYD